MRIARALHAESPVPVLALEHGGALYDVAELDRHFDSRWAERSVASTDFHTRVGALACAGLAELAHELRAGHRPRDARLLPGTYSLLAPCATERAGLVVVTPSASGEPSYAFGNARTLAGHEATIPFPPREDMPDVELGLAAILGEDVHRASAAVAERSILGYALFAGWTARGEERRGGPGTARARDFCPQLGPVLVTPDDVRDLGGLVAEIAAGDARWNLGALGAWPLHPAEAIAFVSEHVELRAGDVVATHGATREMTSARSLALAWDERVSLTMSDLGTLVGKPVRGPGPLIWRRGG